ncbi:MAG: stage III sporulation protein AF [Lachnospiraceae bacterium]
MFDYLYQWIENIACYMLLITMVMQMVPENSYRKYIRFFTSLLLLTLLLTPIFKIAHMDQSLEEIYETAAYEQTTTYLEQIKQPMEEAHIE